MPPITPPTIAPVCDRFLGVIVAIALDTIEGEVEKLLKANRASRLAIALSSVVAVAPVVAI